ncbi:hypothetical protein BU17DRAFT_70887 [Hysterangium stoloniferum]|nr:hypothetical protein BU17DRAFT_70887 [Hysterangium stoloniferum]
MFIINMHQPKFLTGPPHLPAGPGSNNPETSSTESGERNPLLGRQSLVELWVLCKYAAPIFGTQLLEYSLSITSAVFIGRLSTTALAAATLGSMTASVTGFSIVQGLVSCMGTLACIIQPIFAIWTNAEAILLLLRQEPEIAHFAGVEDLSMISKALFSIARPVYGPDAYRDGYCSVKRPLELSPGTVNNEA